MIRDGVSHDWWVRRAALQLFLEGKDLEVYIRDGQPQRVRRGDALFIRNRFWRRVIAIRPYPDFAVMLLTEDYRRIDPRAATSDEVLAALKAMYPAHVERKGVLVFELIGS
jgi:ASC-1-like (ASCH) protein